MSRLTFFSDLAEATIPLAHFWEHTVGSDHAPIVLRADWQRQLQRARKELGFRFVRFHGLLSDDMGTVVRDNGLLHYSFFNSHQIFDFLLSIDMRPFVALPQESPGSLFSVPLCLCGYKFLSKTNHRDTEARRNQFANLLLGQSCLSSN